MKPYSTPRINNRIHLKITTEHTLRNANEGSKNNYGHPLSIISTAAPQGTLT